jgi:hypothetical protein
MLDLDNATGLTVPILRMAANANLVVHSGGRVKLFGLQNFPTIVSSISGAYNFNVLSGGTLEARYYTFEYMNSSGIELFNGSSIDPTNNLSDGTFDNIFPGGTGLFVGDITGSNQLIQISNVAFPTNPGSGFNVSKSLSSDTLEFIGASGTFAGEDFDNDPLEPGGNLIIWTGTSITRTWTGAINSDWNLANNWSPVGVPASDENVVIPSAPRVPVISTNSPLASCYDLQLRDGGALLVNTTRRLDVNGSLYIGADNDNNDGILTLSGTAQVTVGGDYIKQDNSRINSNSSTIILDGTGSQAVVSGGVGAEDELNSLTIDKASGVVSLGGAVLLRGNVTITSGSLNAAGYAMTVGGSWNNSGSFTANGNTVTFNTATAGPVSLTGGGSSFGNVTINAANGAYVYQLGSLLEVLGNLTISRGTLLANGYNIELGGSWSNSGTFTPGTTTLVLDGAGSQTITTGGTGAGKSLYDFTVAKSAGVASLSGDLLAGGAVTISGGSLDAAGNDITVGGNWSDSGGFIAGGGLVTLSATGGGPYGITSGSSFYDMTINAVGVSYQLGSLLDVDHDLTLTAGTLVSQDNTIRVGRHWTNAASFTAGSGLVIFDGSANQNVNTGGVGAGKGFYDVTVQSTGGAVNLTAGLDVSGSLRVQSGTFDMNGLATTVFGNFENSGIVTVAGPLTFDGTSGGPYNITGGGSSLAAVVINAAGVTYQLGGETRMNGNLTVSAGVFDANGQRLVFGDNGADVLSVSGTLEIGAGGELSMFNGSEVVVNSGGVMRVVGVSGTRAVVTEQSGTGSYDFTVSSGATIHARYGLFEYMGMNGINVTDGATIDGVNNFSDVNFDHGSVGGTMLRVGDISGSDQRLVINLAGFITNPGGTSYNVTKTLSSDTLLFENAFGNFAGEAFDNDPLEPTGNLIQWSAVASLRTWTGQQNTNWHNAQNWNPLGVPAAGEDVAINNVTNDPIVSVEHASVRNVTLNTGASLTLQNGFNLDIDGQYVNSNATLAITSSNTTINVAGNWINSGTFTNGQGTVVFDGTDMQEVTAGGSGVGKAFYNMVNTNPDTVRLLGVMDVDRQLSISTGVFDVNGQSLQFGGVTGDQITVSGTLRLNDNSSLQMFAGTQVLVNSGGIISVVGTGPLTHPVVTNQGSGNYHITVFSGGTLECQYATFEYTGNDGIHIQNGGIIDPSAKLDNTLFQNGAGNAYLTISNAQNLVINGVQFDSTIVSRNIYNVVYNGSGSVAFTDYSGNLSGVRYENDNGSGTRGNIRWYFTQNEIVNNESQTFGNDVVITTSANLGSVTVSLFDQVLSIASASVARFYTIAPTNGGGGNLRLVYGDGELQAELEDDLKIWLRREGSWINLAGSVNTSLNFIELTAGEYQLIAGVTDTLVISDAEDDTSLPVELLAFTVFVVNNQVTLEWQTASEIDNAYWLIDRKLVSEEEYNDILQGILEIDNTFHSYTNIATLPGQGTTNSQTDYLYVDRSADLRTIYVYRLADVSVQGQVNFHPVVLLKPAVVPDKFELSQNFPNPFNPETMITYSIPVRSQVVLKIYNILGQEIRTLIEGETDPGLYEIRWDGTNQNRQVVGSGTYIYQISVRSQDGKQSFNHSRKMVLMR